MHYLPEELTGDLVLTVVVNIDGLDDDVLVVEEPPHHDDPVNGIVGDDEAVPVLELVLDDVWGCLLYTSPSPRDKRQSRMPSSA